MSTNTVELIRRFDRPGPRYTSYPTALEFDAAFTEPDYRARLAAADALGDAPLSLYAHLPFCEARCLFCGCNVVITKHRDVAARYLENLETEIDLLADALPHRRAVSQMHWGGGTPTYYPAADLERLFRRLQRHFSFTPDAEVGIEADPRVTTPEHLTRLRALGFNRLSMGVQDFAPEVQESVRRIQSVEQTAGLVQCARAEGFVSVNLDLIYGLPYQSLEGFTRTLETMLGIRPDRVAVYSFAYVPWIRAHMKHLPDASLPGPELKLQLLGAAIDAFTGAGYRAIGMDHFALPEDELSRAIDKRTLHRNFMGYTVQAATDMVALGISGIGDVQGAYAQNVKKLTDYEHAVRTGRLPIERGRVLDDDDLLRRHVITQLMCNLHLEVADVEQRFGIPFERYFARELAELTGPDSPQAHGLLQVTPAAIDVTEQGRLFVRNVCMTFDRYLAARLSSEKPVFSRTV